MPVTDEILDAIQKELQEHAACSPGIDHASVFADTAEIVGFHRGLFWCRKLVESYQEEER